jgi:hypothetical protein
MPVPLRYPVLMPDTPPEVIEQIATVKANRKLKEEVITGARFQQVNVIWEQERINRANARIKSNYIEGLGHRIAEFGAGVWFKGIQEHGPGCWDDPEFIEDTLKKHPEIRIRLNLPTRILVDGFRDKAISSNRGSEGAAEISGRRDTGTAFPAKVLCIKHSAALPLNGCDHAESVPAGSRPGRNPPETVP